MKKSKNTNAKSNTDYLDELLFEECQTADDIPIDWLPKAEPITRSMSYKDSKE